MLTRFGTVFALGILGTAALFGGLAGVFGASSVSDGGGGSVRWENQVGPSAPSGIRLTSPVTTRNDAFGSSVATSRDGSTIVVGATDDNQLGNNAGAAYIFTGRRRVDGSAIRGILPSRLRGATPHLATNLGIRWR